LQNNPPGGSRVTDATQGIISGDSLRLAVGGLRVRDDFMSAIMTAPTAPSPRDFYAVFLRVAPHMAALDHFLRGQLVAFEPEIREMADYCIDTSGKRIRPALVFFSGWSNAEESNAELVQVAAVVELVHLATLVHDDIMDGASVRRGRPAAARRYGAAAAVLLGDAIFAHALHLAASFPSTEVCLAVSESTRRVCAGEIVQTLRRRSKDFSRADYDRVIDLKTAELFRVSCELGARLGGYGLDFAAAAASFGRSLGIAYQIYDDLADFFGREQRIGKTLGTDLASGKLTLPLIILQERVSAAERLTLEAELEGRVAPNIELRLRQMQEHGVFDAVVMEIEAQLKLAEGGLAPFVELSPTKHLQELPRVLRAQVAALLQG
jgi:octaprenyl-diphosphate synthase